MATQTTEPDPLTGLVPTVISIINYGETEISRITSGQETKEQQAEQDKPELNALELAKDSAELIRAHATKISLFIINEPFTPTAIAKVLKELLKEALPSIVMAAQLCAPSRYTATFRKDLAWRCGRVLKELRVLLLKIPSDGKILSDIQKNGSQELGGDKGSLAITGLLWNACDDLTSMAKGGIVAHLSKKVEQYRDTLKDVMEELKEWSEETDDDDEDDIALDYGDADGPAQNVISTQAMLDDMMNSQRHIPADDPDSIRPRLDSCLRRIRLTTILYQAVIKRRLKTLPKLPTPAASAACPRIDEVLLMLKNVPDGFNDVAAAFYELSPADIDKHMDERFLEAFAISEKLLKPWTGAEKDEFTDWALKFQVEIKKNS
ncbi:hypothetical protein GGTG_03154 [Gaeumannomyces tritici R3-111a-1]|uniref:Cyclin-D1-binding protein 1-like N-terminal domain-containing protein n=1 Tax=Gaeumannomyces tritici (strain R3-111a-1) TaxID=644352 RepID=J3NPE6_GAET3|nr:hypothetical protein GGTG_03154 [Gaeumannomyces tritici R3-111a-1]EJT78051.1 hypothetical protein GGTG_03154 [Gaeumannomyces tritici R3-111a-1]